MGCAQSRIENEEAVVRCKERRQWMKSAVSARNAFSTAHSAYVVELKNTGAALAEFGQGESYDPNLNSSYSSSACVESSSSVAPIQPPSDADLLPPPRPSEFFAASLQRSISMPDLPNKFPSKIKPESTIREDDDEGEEEAEADDKEEEDEEEERGTRLKRRHRTTRADSLYENINTPVPPPPTVDHHDDESVTLEKVVIEPPLPPNVPKRLKQGPGAARFRRSTWELTLWRTLYRGIDGCLHCTSPPPPLLFFVASASASLLLSLLVVSCGTQILHLLSLRRGISFLFPRNLFFPGISFFSSSVL